MKTVTKNINKLQHAQIQVEWFTAQMTTFEKSEYYNRNPALKHAEMTIAQEKLNEAILAKNGIINNLIRALKNELEQI